LISFVPHPSGILIELQLRRRGELPRLAGRKFEILMKRIRWMGWVLAAGLAAACLVACTSDFRGGSATATVARWRFVGATQLQTQSIAPALASLLTGTNSGPTADRLATNLTRVLLQRLGRSDVPAATAVLAPLLADVFRHESAGEVGAKGWRMTVKLPAGRWSAWEQAGGLLGGLTENATGAVLAYTNGWLNVGGGSVSGAGWLTLSNGAVWAAEGDLARIFHGAAEDWPRARLGVSLEGGRVVTRASLDFLKNPLSPLPEWKLPERMAHGPFSQFAAARGVSRLAGRIDWWREAFAGQPPDQVFWWSQPEVPFRNWMAVPTQDPKADLQRLFATIGKVFGEQGVRFGRAVMATNQSAFAILETLQGLEPVVSQVKQGDGSFLLASLYPAARTTNAISANLRRLLAEKDVVYQDAEFTPEAIDHWNVLFQLNQMLQSNRPNARNARAHSWMVDNRASLGDSETLVRQVTPNRLALERKSSAGITGLELVLLTRWLDGDDYQRRRPGVPPMPTGASQPPKP